MHSVHAHGREPVGQSLAAAALDLTQSSVGLQHRVINVAREVPAGGNLHDARWVGYGMHGSAPGSIDPDFMH